MSSRVRATSAGRSTSGRVEGLAFSLQDTNQNLRAVQRMLQNLGDGQTKSDVDDIPSRSNVRSQSHRPSARHAACHETRAATRRRTAASDRDEYHRDRGAYRNTERSNVQYFDRMNTSLGDGDIHEFHQSLRDLSSGQQRLAAELERERERGRRLEAESLGKYGNDEALDRVDRRLQRIDDEFRAERAQLKSKQDEVAKVSAELKLALERQRKKDAEDAVRSTMTRREDVTDKTYLRQQLDLQAEQLKDYLQKTSEQRQTEQEIQNLKAQMTRLVGGGEGGGRRDSNDDHRERDRLEAYNRELMNIQRQLEASNARSEELKSQAQETIKLWKAKNQKLTKDCEKHTQRADAAEHRAEELSKELEGHRSRSSTVQQQFDLLLKEFNDLMSVRVDLDERLTQRESQTNELTCIRKDLENELTDSRVVIETLEKELRAMKEQAYAASDECSQLTERCKEVQSAATSSNQTVQRLKKELQEANAAKNDLSSRFARASAENSQLSSEVTELRRTHSSAVQELSDLQTRIRENKDSIQLSEIRSRYKIERAHAAADLEAQKMQIQEERSINKLAKKQENNLREELDRTTRELTMSRDECAAAEQRCFALRQELVANAFQTEDGISLNKEIELQLMDAKETLAKISRNHDNDLDTLALETEAIFSIVFDGEKTPSVNSLHNPIEHIMSDNKTSVDRFIQIRSQLNRIKLELRHRQTNDIDARARKLAVDKNDQDCEFLLSEIKRKNETLDRLTAEKILEKELNDLDKSSEKIIERDLERLRVGQERSKSPAENRTDQGRFLEEYRKVGNDRLTPTNFYESKCIHIPPATADFKDTQKVTVIRISSEDVPREDNDEIKTRYERLKESVGALQQDVNDVDMFRVHSSKRNSDDLTRATPIKNRDNLRRPKRPDHVVRPGKKSVRLVA